MRSMHTRTGRTRQRLLATTILVWLLGCGSGDGADDGTPATAGASSEAVTERVRDPVPAFDLRRLGGGRIESAGLEGKIVIVDFWATWCPPCEFQVPELNAFWEAHRDEPDLEVYGVSVDTAGEDVVAEWVSQQDVRYPVLLDGEPLARKVGALGFPTLLVIAPDGRIDEQHVGLIERATLEEALDRLRQSERADDAEPAVATDAPPAAG
jgi:peroxiredoxin